MTFTLELPLPIKFIYSEKATKFWEISTVNLTVTTKDKSKVDISQKFLALSEYTNFIGRGSSRVKVIFTCKCKV